MWPIPLNLPDVNRLDPTCPYHFDKEFDETTHYTTRSVLTIPLLTSKGDLLGILQIINAQDETRQLIPFTASDEKMMMHFASIAAVALARAQMTRAILLRMMKMAEMRDPKEEFWLIWFPSILAAIVIAALYLAARFLSWETG